MFTATKANLPADNKATGVPDDVAKQMGSQLTTQLMNQITNTKLHITAKKVTSISGNGTEESNAYKIIKRPDANTLVVKGKDSEVTTFTKSGKYLCIPTTGAVQFKMYFKPVD